MKSADEMYDDLGKDDSFCPPCDYGPMLNSIGTIVVQVDDSDYQGDSRVLYRDGERWGVLLFGWSSCSGCDSLQACNSRGDIEKLRDSLSEDVKWGTREETIDYLKSKDFETESTYREKEVAEFLDKALAALRPSP